MTRLERELRSRGIIFDAPDCPSFIEQDCERELVTITDTVIVTVYYSAVLPAEFHLFDRKTFAEIGCQNVYPEPVLFGKGKTWGSGIYAD